MNKKIIVINIIIKKKNNNNKIILKIGTKMIYSKNNIKKINKKTIKIIKTYHLVRNHQSRLQLEFAPANIKQILQAVPQKVHDHDVVVRLYTIPPHVRDADSATQDAVQPRLVEQLRVLRLDALLRIPSPQLGNRISPNY
jgi:hypothetical protein